MTTPTAAMPSLATALLRGVCGRCPNCGQGKLLRKFTKPVEACSVCGEAFGHIRADDGPAWLTILIVGHILGALALTIVPNYDWPEWVSYTFWPLAALTLILLLMPRAKGFFIALIWRTGSPGSEK